MEIDALPTRPGGSCTKEQSRRISVLTARLAIATLKRGGQVAQSVGSDSQLFPGIDYCDAAVREVPPITRDQIKARL